MHRLTRWAVLAGVVSLILMAAAAVAGGEAPVMLTLDVGTSQNVTVGNVSRVAIGDASVADVSISGPDSLKVTALAKGRTTLLVWDETGAKHATLITVKAPKEAAPTGGPPPALDITPPAMHVIGLKVGAKVRRSFPGLIRIAVGDAAIADVEAVDDAVLIKGLAKGKTTILIWGRDGKQALKIQVSGP